MRQAKQVKMDVKYDASSGIRKQDMTWLVRK